MKIYEELNLCNFEAWSGAKNTLATLTYKQMNELENILEDIFPDGCSATDLNDYLWFEKDAIAETLGFRNWEHLERSNNGDYEKLTIKCSNIIWDVDEDEEDENDLPIETTLTFEDEDDIEEYYEAQENCDTDVWISDKLSDEYGYCVESFDYEEVR